MCVHAPSSSADASLTTVDSKAAGGADGTKRKGGIAVTGIARDGDAVANSGIGASAGHGLPVCRYGGHALVDGFAPSLAFFFAPRATYLEVNADDECDDQERHDDCSSGFTGGKRLLGVASNVVHLGDAIVGLGGLWRGTTGGSCVGCGKNWASGEGAEERWGAGVDDGYLETHG